MASLTGASIASSYTSLLKLNGNTDTLVAGASGNAIQVVDGDGTASPVYLNTDRIGLNTNNPDSPFTITDTGGGNTVTLNHSTSPTGGSGTGAHIYFRSGSATLASSTLRGWLGYYDNANEGAGTRLNIRGYAGTYIGGTSSTTNGLTVDSSNNVGIGTASPSVMLNLKSATSTTITAENTGDGAVSLNLDANRGSANQGLGNINFQWNGSTVAQISGSSGADTTNKDDGQIYFSTTSGGSSAIGMTLTKEGYLGVGSSVPNLYEVSANNFVIYEAGNAGLTIAGGTGNTGSIHFADGVSGADAYRGYINYNHAENSMRFGTDGSENMRIESDGTTDHKNNYIVNEQGRQNHVANTMSSPYYRFDGSNDVIDCGNIVDLSTGDFSVSAYLYHDTSNSNHAGIVGIRGGGTTEFQFYIHTDDKLASYNGSDNVYSTSAISNQQWTHVVLVQSDGNKLFYINGNLDNTASQARGSASSQTLKIGYSGNGSEYFQGQIQNVKVWNKALTATEIKDDYSGASVPFKYKGANQTNLLTGWTNSGSYGFANWGASGADITQFDGDGSLSYAYTNTVPFVVGAKYRLTVVLDNTSGSLPNLMIAETNGANSVSGTEGSFNFGGTELADGTNIFEFTATSAFTTSKRVVLQENATSVNNSATFELIRIGAVAEFDGSSAGSKVWGDKSGNDLHGTVGAGTLDATAPTLENTPYDSGTEYEEGTWTPVVKSGSNVISVGGGTVSATYVKIGRQVTVKLAIEGSSTSGTTGSSAFIEGLPYACGSTEQRCVGSMFYGYGLNLNLAGLTVISQATSKVFFKSTPDSADYAQCTFDATSGTTYAGFAITYFTD